jgi:hypothetical protein
MAVILGVVSMIAGLGSLVCWILTLIKLFTEEGVLQGIIGIICGLYALIMGFVRMQQWAHQTVMIAWSICLVLSIVCNVIAAAMTTASMP